MKQLLLSVFVLGAFLASIPAFACSFPPPEWFVNYFDAELTVVADGPFTIPLVNYGDMEQIPEDRFSVQVLDENQLEVAGETTFDSEKSLILFLPEEPVTGGTLTVTTTGELGEPDLTMYALNVLEDFTIAAPTLSTEGAERELLGGSKTCCDAANDQDSSCIVDSCGGYENGEMCRVCWNGRYVYQPVVTVSFESLESPTGWIEYVVDDGFNVARVQPRMPSNHNLQAIFEEGTLPPYCVTVTAINLLTGESVDSEESCLDDVERLDRQVYDSSEIQDRCEPGTIAEVDPDPINNIGGPNPPGDDDTGKSDAGCCATQSTRDSHVAFALFLLMAVFMRRPNRR